MVVREDVPDDLHVFISYRRSDSGPYARNVYDALAERLGRDRVFYDIDGIAPGRDFVEVLDETLQRADVLLVVIGPNWVDVRDEDGERRLDDGDDYVRMEVERALAKREVRVIPVLVGGAKMPPARVLPEALAPLTRRNAVSLIEEHWRATLNELITVLERIGAELARSGRDQGSTSLPEARSQDLAASLDPEATVPTSQESIVELSDDSESSARVEPLPASSPPNKSPETATPSIAKTDKATPTVDASVPVATIVASPDLPINESAPRSPERRNERLTRDVAPVVEAESPPVVENRAPEGAGTSPQPVGSDGWRMESGRWICVAHGSRYCKYCSGTEADASRHAISRDPQRDKSTASGQDPWFTYERGSWICRAHRKRFCKQCAESQRTADES